MCTLRRKYIAIEKITAKENRAKRIQIRSLIRAEKARKRAELQSALAALTKKATKENSKSARAARRQILSLKRKFREREVESEDTQASGSSNQIRPAKKQRNMPSKKYTENTQQECYLCGALVWSAESNEKSSTGEPLFTICCQKGRVTLPESQKTPKELAELSETQHYKNKNRAYNSLMAMTSIGAKVEQPVITGQGPPTFRIHGQNYHKIGSLIPIDGHPKFGQLYIFDTANEVKNRISIMTKEDESAYLKDGLKEEVVETLIKMLDKNNVLTKELRNARDRYESGETDFTIRLVGQKHLGRQYDLPTGEEIAGLVVGSMEDASRDENELPTRDVIVQYKSAGFQRIGTLHQHYMALQYPLLFPYGESGFHMKIPYRQNYGSKIRRKYLTIREFYAYQLQTRLSQGKTLIKGGRLLHQYIVDAYTAIEKDRLRFNGDNQKQLRADLYNNVCDAIGKGDNDSKALGRKVILLATFTGGPRNMQENYHDAMALCKTYGNPHLFITIMANPNWREITEHLQTYSNDGGNERPDVASCVFKMKLNEMIKDFKEGVFFGPLQAVVYTIEFQKCGLSHAHILLWLQGYDPNPDPAVIDSIISAELPDEKHDPEGFELVKKHMMHGPCGIHRPQSPCMEIGICSKKYPRAYANKTTTDKSGYVIYKREEDEESFVM